MNTSELVTCLHMDNVPAGTGMFRVSNEHTTLFLTADLWVYL